MRRIPTRRSTSSVSYKTAFLILLALVGGGLATVGGLWAAGVDLPFLKHGPDLRGLVAVPVNARPIPAFTKVTREDFFSAETHEQTVAYRRPEDVKRMGLITEPDKIIGRVVGHDKPALFAFHEKDFLPTGTRSGIVAGIPPGKRMITIDATKIQGIHALVPGDRIDIVASTPIDMQKVLGHGSSVPGTAGVQAGILAQVKQARVRILVQNGAVVSAVKTRAVPITSNSLTSGAVTRTKPVQEASIAVDPEEIAPLTEAIATEATITCVARSGRPDDPESTSVTPAGVDPSEHVAAIERIVGGRREVFFVPRTPKKAVGKELVAVPICGKRIPARTKVTRDHLIDPTTGRLHQIALRPEDAERLGILTDLERIVGRVVTFEKLADSAFKEGDFTAQEESVQTATKEPVTDPEISHSHRHVRRFSGGVGLGAGPVLSPRGLP